MYKLKVIGTEGHDLGKRESEALAECGLVVATDRLRSLASALDIPYQSITPLSDSFAAIHRYLANGNVAMLASGDPLFYGIGKRLIKEFGPERLQFYPALTSLQRACARWQMPWDDATVVSLHGREAHHLPGRLLNSGKTLLFTDSHWRPERIAAELFDYLSSIGAAELLRSIRMLVAEDLDLDSEKITRGSLADILNGTFSPLNVVALLTPGDSYSATHRFGLGEEEFHHSRGLITKNEVRAASLHQLRLPNRGILWDIGGGSGSVGIEAARLFPGLTVYSIEQKTEELVNIKSNINKFGCFNLVPVAGRAPEALAGLPRPDRIFVGGSSGALADIIAVAADILNEGERLVVNGVLTKTVDEGQRLMRKHGFSVQTATIEVTRTTASGETVAFNPITIMTGIR